MILSMMRCQIFRRQVFTKALLKTKKPSALKPRTPKSQLKRSKRVRKPNLGYANAMVIEVRKNKRT